MDLPLKPAMTPRKRTTTKRHCVLCKCNIGVSLHALPKNHTDCLKWLEILQLQKENVNSNTRVCSAHFHPTSFSKNAKRVYLIPGSLPNQLPRVKQECVEKTEEATSCIIDNSSLHLNSPNEIMRKNIFSTLSTDIPVNDNHFLLEAKDTEVKIESSSSCVEHLKVCTSLLTCPMDMPTTSFHNQSERNAENNFADRSMILCTSVSNEALGTPKHRRYIGDIDENVDLLTPKRAKKNFQIAKATVEKQRRKIKTLQEANRRFRKKIANLKDLLQCLRSKKLISEEAQQILEGRSSDTLHQIIRRKLQGQKSHYSADIRSFALTLQFYSSKAYNYVRKCFNNILPHLSTISRWYSVTKGDPGFTEEAFLNLKMKAINKEVLINLTLDEMAIKGHIQWKNNKFYGYVDMGTGVNYSNDNCPHAKNCLVFMAVAINDHWKMPLGYFLIHSLDASERANLLSICLQMIAANGVHCHSVTFDGAAVNLAMCRYLGAVLEYSDNLKPWILNPTTNEKIYIFLDPCHMLKLVRNSLASVQHMKSGDGEVSWTFFEKLQEYQSQQGLLAGNKIT